jgi:hypothetical protein
METAETTMETDGDGSGGTSLSWQGAGTETSIPEICLRRQRRCGTVLGKTPILLGFPVPKLFIGERASSEVDQGGLTTKGAARGWAAPPHGEASPWPPSGSLSVLVLRPGKIGVWVFVSSNSENISCVAFLKHKNSKKKQGTGTVASCQ